MRITSIYLKGYKRLSLSGIDILDIKIEKRIVCILGSNGSGKSSVILQLSPLPGIYPADFNKGGCKILVCEKGEDKYSLESHFDDDRPRYLFIKNGENLNHGRTITVFKELVKTEFGITDEIHEVMIGAIPFNEMQVNQRRQWFTKMPGVNYDYAIQYYKKLKEKHKLTEVLIKNANETLIRDKAQLLSTDQIQDINHAIVQMKDALESLLMSKDASIPSYDEIVNYKKNLIERSRSALSDYDRSIQYYSREMSDIDYTSLIRRQESSLLVCESEISSVVAQMEAVQNKISELGEYSTDDIGQAPAQIQSIDKEIETIKASLQTVKDIDLNTVRNVYATLLSASHALYDTVPSLEEHAFSKYSNTSCMDIKARIQANDISINKTKEEYSAVSAQLNHLLNHKNTADTQCPNCNHSWKIGYSERDEVRLTNKRISLHNHLSTLHNEDAILKKEYEHQKEQLSYMDVVSNYYKVVYTCIPSLVVDNEDMGKASLSVSSTLLSDIKKHVAISELLANRDKLSAMLKAVNDQTLAHRLSLTKDLDVLSAKYTELRAGKFKIQESIKDLKKSHVLCLAIDDIKKRIEEIIKDTSSYKRVVKRHMLLVAINRAVVSLKTEIATLEHRSVAANLQLQIVDRTQTQIAELTLKQKLLKDALKKLSPVDGLIAQGLQKFLSSFVKDMNIFIDKIWTYPLEIKCDTPNNEELDVDFKFEVVPEGSSGVPDASKTSAGQKEVIDLAFRLSSMKYRGLQDYPIYLDEFGVHMDHTHKHRAVKAITDIVVQNDNTQIFLVSHFSSAYASLSDAQFVILHKDNIIVPDGLVYNNNVNIVYNKQRV